VPPVTVEPRIWFNSELRSALFLVPGLIAFIGMIVSAISTALSVVREKERGTWEQVRMAPVGTVSYIVGKTLPYLVLAIITSMAIVVSAMVLFDLPMRGSWASLLLASSLFLLGALATGLLVSTIAVALVAFRSRSFSRSCRRSCCRVRVSDPEHAGPIGGDARAGALLPHRAAPRSCSRASASTWWPQLAAPSVRGRAAPCGFA
jgi:hypothetical protein